MTAIDHREPDRLPLSYGAWREVSQGLCSQLGLDPACEWTHFQEFPETLMQRLHVDIRTVRARYLGPGSRPLPDGNSVDMFGVIMSPDNYPVGHPLAHAATVEEVRAYPMPDPEAFDYEHYAEQCERFEEYAVCGGDWSPFWTISLEIMGTAEFLMAMRSMPEVAYALLERVADYYYETTRRMFEASRGKLDIFFMGDDYGTQVGTFVSVKDFRSFIAPHLGRLYRLAKSYGLKVMQHSCGSVRGFLPEMIALGMDILDPVQVRAAGMEMGGLKRDFGSQITFHGSMDTQHTLPHGSVEEVRQEVLDRLKVAAPGGGLILTGSQDYIRDIPLENILAIYDTAYERGKYPIQL
jgi:uroporphyrinogen decarboxylase